MKKRMIPIFVCILTALVLTVLPACSAMDKDGSMWYAPGDYSDDFASGDSFDTIVENKFIATADEARSSFSLDANSASYSYLRSVITKGGRVNANAVHIEEMINYFSYEYPAPEGDAVLSVTGKLGECPWNAEHRLLSVGVRTKSVELSDVRNNLVFLIDSSGSMYGADRLGLVQNAFALMTENLTEGDRVSLVTYAGDARVLLRGERGDEGVKIRQAVYDITAGGSTAGARGIETAYALARENYIEGGNNRVILATDGDFNVGVSSKDGLEALIEEKRDSGIYLSVLGVGLGNYRNDKMETLARHGNGNHYYIDSLFTARKVLVEEMGGTLVTVARDAKAQVVFDPSVVESYRLIGYENKLLTPEQFEDDKTDAGELGSGLTATALYEVVLQAEEGTAATVTVRYKDADTTSDATNEVSAPVSTAVVDDEDSRFIAAVAQFGLLLRNSAYKGTATYADLLEQLAQLPSTETDLYRKDFRVLVARAADIYGEAQP